MMESQKAVKETTRGRITIPAEFRRKLGVEGEGLWEMSLVDGSLTLVPITSQEADQNHPALQTGTDDSVPLNRS